LNTVIPRVHPTRSAITVAGIVGTRDSCSRIASSNASTAEPARFRSYLGGASEAIAARTVFREIPNILAMVLMPNPSARRSLRISAQSSTLNPPFAPLDSLEPRLGSKGVSFRSGISFQPALKMPSAPIACGWRCEDYAVTKLGDSTNRSTAIRSATRDGFGLGVRYRAAYRSSGAQD
jgi:hypothetical protein